MYLKFNIMKAKELAEKLMKNPEAEVVITSDNFELNGATIPVSSVFPFNGKMESKSFRDAFDGGTYNSNVITWDTKSDTVFLKIS